jgi:hypothetical protein
LVQPRWFDEVSIFSARPDADEPPQLMPLDTGPVSAGRWSYLSLGRFTLLASLALVAVTTLSERPARASCGDYVVMAGHQAVSESSLPSGAARYKPNPLMNQVPAGQSPTPWADDTSRPFKAPGCRGLSCHSHAPMPVPPAPLSGGFIGDQWAVVVAALLPADASATAAPGARPAEVSDGHHRAIEHPPRRRAA